MMLNQAVSVCPLSQSQKNIWNLEQGYPGTSVNHITTTVRVDGRLDLLLLQKAVQSILAADDSLRIRIRLQDALPVQYISPYENERFEIYDFSLSGEAGLALWEQAAAKDAMPVIDGALYRFWFFKIGENKGGVLFKLHHLISDGYSQIALCDKIQKTYLALLAGESPVTESPPVYFTHVAEEESYLQSARAAKDRQYWRQALGEKSEAASIRQSKSAALSPVGARLSLLCPKSISYAMFTYCEKNRVAPFAVFYLALAVYLKKAARADRPMIGVPVVNRLSFAEKQTTGMFVSTLPFAFCVDEDKSFSQLADEFLENWYELLRHQRLPFSEIDHIAAETGLYDGRLFHIALSYLDNRVFTQKRENVTFSGKWHYSGFQAEQLCIHLSNFEGGRQLAVEYDYLTQLFSEEEIRSFHESLTQVLEEMLAEPQKPVGRVALLPKNDWEAVLYDYNQIEVPPLFSGLDRQLAHVLDTYPDRVVTIHKGRRVHYRTLREQAAKMGAAMAGAGLFAPEEKNPLVAILLPTDHSLYFAIAGALWAGVPYLVLSKELPTGRIGEILKQSGARALVSTGALVAGLGVNPADFGIQIIDADNLPAEEIGLREPGGDALAYVVYTSGSTGAPKGVEITRKNLQNLAQAMAPYYGSGAVLSLCNVGFDAFVLESAAALLNGMTIVLPGEEEGESPAKLAELVRSYRVGFLSLTPSRLAALIKNEDFAKSIRNIQTIICGGEAFTGGLFSALRGLTGANIYNQYGPSETTVAVSMQKLGDSSAITAGRPMQNCRLYVLDRWRQPLPVGVYGDLYIGGACVGAGYRAAPQLTEQSFFESPFETGERIYKTGDLACWTRDGEIVLAGRSDRQIKLRGLRIEPGEIAARLAGYPGVKAAAAKVYEQNGQGVLAAYYTADRPLSETALMAYLGEYLPRYMVPAYFVYLDTMPQTASGKVDENRLPLPAGEENTAVQEPADALEKEILEIFKQVLDQSDLSVHSDYFAHGGNSLNAMEAVSLITERVGRGLRISDMYLCKTARTTARFIKEQGEKPTESRAIAPAPTMQYYPLSPTQESIYVQSARCEMAYHMPGAFVLGAAPDIVRLQTAFYRLIAEEEILRTGFVFVGGGICTFIQPQADFSLPVLLSPSFDEAAAEFLAPFALDTPPLLRAALWQDEAGRWVLFIDSHHIIGDGLSTPLVLARLESYYQTGRADVPPLHYKDYAYATATGDGAGADAFAYWKGQLLPMPEMLKLPTDYKRPKEFDFNGRQYAFGLRPGVSALCKKLCEEQSITPYVLFLSVFGLLLKNICGQLDFIIGTPVAGRADPGLKHVLGPFINTLPLRLQPDDEQSVAHYLQAVRRQVTGALDHPDMPLEEMLDVLGIERSLAHNPLYQVLFSLRPVDASAFTLGGKAMTYVPVATNTSKLDLSLEAAETNGEYTFVFEYAASLFFKETIALFARSYEAILQGVLTGTDKPVHALPALSPADWVKYIQEPTLKSQPFINLPVHRMIENRAAIDPDGVAVIFGGKEITYKALEARAAEIAGLLVQNGAQKGDKIALCAKRTPDLFAAILGILKAGCAYVPFLDSYPVARVQYMLENAGVKVALVSDEWTEKYSNVLPVPVISLAQKPDAAAATVPVSGEDLMYILYTSGSTGVPKGVMLNHKSLSNLFFAMEPFMRWLDGPILCSTNVVFDTFFTESLFALALGLPVVLADDEQMILPWEIAALAKKYGVQMIQFTPSRLMLCLQNEAFCAAAAGLAQIILVGETFTDEMLEAFCRVSTAKVLNMYGPTEAAVYVTAGYLGQGQPVHIGTPLANCRLYILDEKQRPVMPGAYGEMYLAGVCLASGYIAQPDLTESLFVPDPFCPGEKMYRSGDFARLRADGQIDFLGRADSQIKIAGQRVELDEISSAILRTGLAAQTAVLPYTRDDGSVELYSFVVPKEGAGFTKEKIYLSLQDFMPNYMIPTKFILLDEMPVNPSGKTDMAVLKRRMTADARQGVQTPPQSADYTNLQAGPTPAEKEQEPVPAAQNAPIGQAQIRTSPDEATPAGEPVKQPVNADDLIKIWQQALPGREILPDRSFFEMGGSSLGALGVLNRYFNQGTPMTLAQFYDHPTIHAQLALLQDTAKNRPENQPGQKAPTQPVPARSETVFSSASVSAATTAPTVRKKVPPPAGTFSASLPGCIFLTGATGYLGAHLLHALVEKGAVQIICLVRSGPAKLLQVLCGYFGYPWVQQNAGHINFVQGDLTKPNFGVGAEEYQALCEKVQAVYHCAADVRHYVKDETNTFAVNTRGTETMVTFAKAAGAVFHHISTASVGGDYLTATPEKPATFCEEDLDIGQNWAENPYIKSKYLAEEIVCKGIQDGLMAKIYRVGRLVGRSDGVFQHNPDENMFYLFIKGVAALGYLPESMQNAVVDLTPVDVCAKAIVALLPGERTAYHLVGPTFCTLLAAAQAVRPDILVVPDEAFTRYLAEAAVGEGAADMATLVNVYSQTRTEMLMNIKIETDKTRQELARAGFNWQALPPEILLQSF